MKNLVLRLAVLLAMTFAGALAQAPKPAAPAAQPVAAPAPSLCAMPLAKQAELLGGRLTAQLPASAEAGPPVSNLMGVQQSPKDETDINLESGEQKAAILVHEMNQTAGPDFADKVKGEASDSANVEPITGNGLHGFLVTPKMVDTSAPAPLVGGAYLVRDDSTIQSIGVYMNSAAVKDPAACTAWAKKLIAGVAAGPAKLEAAAGDRRIPLDNKADLVAKVPAGYVLSNQAGSDFNVYRLRKLTAFGAPRGSLGIYIGDHPAPQHKQAQVDPAKVTASKGTLLGKPVTWEQWSPGEEGGHAVQVKEAILPLPQAGDPNLQLHIFMAATDQQLLPELSQVAESLQVQPH